MNYVLVATIIDLVVITSKNRPDTAIAAAASRYIGLGRPEETRNYISNASVYDPYNGSELFRVSGLRYHRLDVQEEPYIVDHYSKAT